MEVRQDEQEAFFSAVDEACKKAVWCAIATVRLDQPRVRIIHPSWEGATLWFATGIKSPKADQIRANPMVDIQYQVSPPDFVHVMVRGKAELISDLATKQHAWDAIDYDLTMFGTSGPDDPNFCPVRVIPTRVELSEMFGSTNKRVWRC
ncbi:MAG: pyridoxamine 5'-phosphate oxidase family protein [Gammaproteobacteria bacterium]|jgi:general stress protein 26|nr:pyridoxamine 5'-phosphate oxidase family protein [Gammaproteobacteria bacterium]MBT5202006.1 pyridoxamine 5'-phosphate oxidase family protein [Gammaproteobacteria bacterium]MBT5601221.1 pyridoxamine 5'-phosphate oxidase family protein [Gammaproteobacteria bacterium]MBT6243904.1 pyridoxamine 5'-phosphate oxidase family protein [Gammaproteobacteria bacterium]